MGGEAVTRQRSSLAKLRSRAAELHDPEGLRRLRRELRDDPRSGANLLERAIEARLQKLRIERRRVAKLFARRRELFACGHRLVAGVDEVGVGPLAGPVVAAAVILKECVDLPGLNDSKKLSRRVRENLDAAIRSQALAVGIGQADPSEIDRINILQATLQAMKRAVAALPSSPDHLLVDARTIPGVEVGQTALVGGDGRDGSIAAASIVAKVHRDALMRGLDQVHPGYGLARHMGYGTAEHMQALRRLGASPIHRQSFRPVAEAPQPSATGP